MIVNRFFLTNWPFATITFFFKLEIKVFQFVFLYWYCSIWKYRNTLSVLISKIEDILLLIRSYYLSLPQRVNLELKYEFRKSLLDLIIKIYAYWISRLVSFMVSCRCFVSANSSVLNFHFWYKILKMVRFVQ